MKNCNYKKLIRVDNLYYEMHVTKDHDVSFSLEEGRFKDGQPVLRYEDSFYFNSTRYFTNNLVKNPRKVIQCFLENVLQYIYEYRPPYIQFCAMEKKRARLYERLLPHISSNYEPILYDRDGHKGFMLIRKLGA